MANRKRFYCKNRGAMMWFVICAPTKSAATTKFLAGTRYTREMVTVQAKKPRTKFPIAGINTKLC